jgi:hypothetical protein
MKISNEYDVIFAELNNGEYETEKMVLKKVSEYKGKEIYFFRDEHGYELIQYNHEGNIDWDFVEEINEKFGY